MTGIKFCLTVLTVNGLLKVRGDRYPILPHCANCKWFIEGEG